MEWTREQSAVLDTARKSQMVAAAAGSGKTTVMTEYVTRQVMAGMSLERICVVTFTHAAADQMRQKIAEKLRRAAEENPALRSQADRVESAWISTVHALCDRLILRYGASAGLSVGAALLGEQEQSSLWHEAFEDSLGHALMNRLPGLELLIRLYGGRDGRELIGPVSDLRTLCMARPEGMTLAQTMLKATRETDAQTWQELRSQQLRRTLRPAEEWITQALALCRNGGVPPESVQTLQDDLEDLRALRIPGMKGSLSRKTKGFDPMLIGQVRRLREPARELMKHLETKARTSADLEPVLPALEALVVLTQDAHDRYTAAKEIRNGMDFDDLEHGALAVIAVPEIARELRRQFDLVLVDEYQDTNPVQEAILTAISRPDNLFTVGDVKQAIYRFRQADPGIFLARAALPDDENRVLHRLNANFRSAQGVVDFVNLIFGNLMTQEKGGVDYDDSQRLMARAGYPDDPDPVTLLIAPAKDEENAGELEELNRLELQVRSAAGWIAKRMGQQIYDPRLSGYRPARYGDFAILLRKRQGRVALAAQMLEEMGIPAYASGGDWFQQPEVQETRDLLRLVDNRRRDSELLSCLHSAYCGFTMAELWEIRRAQPQGSFADGAELFAQGEGPLAQRLRRFFQTLEGWREDAMILPPEELIQRILEESGYYCAAGAMSAGMNRQANLRLLVSTARNLAASRNRGLYGLLRYLEDMEQGGNTLSAAQLQTEGQDSVQVCTIHGSKGLEYPIVLLLETDQAMNAQSYREDRLQMDAVLGFGPRTLEEGRLLRSLQWQVIGQSRRQEDASEEVRILYVALTRAQQQLVLVISEPSEKRLNQWLLPPRQAVLLGDSYADGIMPMLLRCQGTESLGGEPCYPVAVKVESVTREENAPPLPEPFPPQGPPDEKLLRELDWQYPYPQHLSAKLAVTDLLPEPEGGLTRPGRSGRLSARERGTLTHSVLEHLSGSPEETLAAMVNSGLISRRDAREVELDWLRRWMAHPLFAQMQKSPDIRRELPFTLTLPARELLPTQAEENMMIQGVIDLAFRRENGWVLVDFKTGDVWPGREAEYAAHYRPQIALYRRALEMLTGLPVLQSGIYLLPNGIFMEDSHA